MISNKFYKYIKKYNLILSIILLLLLIIYNKYYNTYENYENGNNKTLVIILSETRASELTFENFKKNVLDELNADLCLCIGVKSNYNYDDLFYKEAKYHFIYNEPDDYGDAFEYAYKDYIEKTGKTPEIHWREFLKIKDQYLGGIKDQNEQHPGSAGILIFFRIIKIN